MIELAPEQIEAVNSMKNGCILIGDTGSGKSRTAIAYYYKQFGGDLNSKDYVKMHQPKDLYIITTARKRDELDWEPELIPFFLCTHGKYTPYTNRVVVDSWNNIQKYKKITNAFFIFDEQRVIGSGSWVKTFLKLTQRNQWVLLTATPGDDWKDYIPVFVANGFYKNKTEFLNMHATYCRHSHYPKITGYVGTHRLEKFRDMLQITINHVKHTTQHHIDKFSTYDVLKYKTVGKTRWNPFEDKPIVNASELCYIWRKIVNSDQSKQEELLKLLKTNNKVIVFYNFDYELNILRELIYPDGHVLAEWNGHKHEPIPDSDKWVYLVQYTAGNEGWNCITTDTVVFFSPNYSYRVIKQSSGRIDRRNTKFTDLYYYHLKTKAPIDLAISRAIKNKKKFNERNFIKHF